VYTPIVMYNESVYNLEIHMEDIYSKYMTKTIKVVNNHIDHLQRNLSLLSA
jgi:hypothetical protein